MTELANNELSSLLEELNSEDVKSIHKSSNETEDNEENNEETENNLEDSGDEESDHEFDEQPNDTDIDLDAIYNSSINELVSNYRKDRKDIDQYIKFLWKILKKQKPSRIVFEALATSLRTKSEANTNLLKLIDNINKRLDKKDAGGEIDLQDLL